MREYEIKGLSTEEVMLIVKTLLVASHAGNDEDELNLINEVLRKIKKSVETD